MCGICDCGQTNNSTKLKPVLGQNRHLIKHEHSHHGHVHDHHETERLVKVEQDLGVKDHSLLAIENVGNLVCPSSFDLGTAFDLYEAGEHQSRLPQSTLM